MEEEAEDKDDSKRKTRNLSEKKRRDQFNMLVNELGSMVSTNNNRKMDKSTVLRSTISFLKNHNEITLRSRDNAVQEDWKPAFLTNEEFTYLVLEALECFIMVFSASGYIYYVSESVTSLLGHNPNDILNKSIFDLTYEEDRPNILEILSNPTASASGINSDNEVTFQCHVQRGALDIQDAITYELVQFNGCFRTNAELSESCDLSFEQDHEPRVLFVCTGKLCTPQLIRDVSLVDPSRNEFTSRHSLEWKFLFLDHRAPPIIGYLPFEVLGTSGYDYYHFDDLEKVVTCHEALMQKGEMMSCYYRFLTKGQQWIWLQTRFYITYHQWNSKPEFVVCNHRVVSYSDVDDNPKQEVTEQDARSDVEAGPSGLHEPSPDRLAAVSPSYMSDNSEAFGNSYHSVSQPPSLKSTATSAGSTSAAATGGTATTAAASWATRPSHIHYAAGSDTGSVSGESRSSQWNSSQQSLRMPELVPQHGIGAQYLEPVPYVSAVGVPGVLPLPLQALPVIVTPDQAQLQEQLQRTHRELQELIVRQQEELRQVKEQLLLARLGILQPIINVQDPYAQTAELQQGPRLPAQLVYEGSQPRAMAGYPLSPHSPLHQPHQPHQPPSRQPLQPHQPPSRQPLQPHQPPSRQPLQPHQPPSRQPLQPQQPPSRQLHQPPSHQPHQPPSRQPHQPHEPPPPDHPAHYSQDQLHPNMPQ